MLYNGNAFLLPSKKNNSCFFMNGYNIFCRAQYGRVATGPYRALKADS